MHGTEIATQFKLVTDTRVAYKAVCSLGPDKLRGIEQIRSEHIDAFNKQLDPQAFFNRHGEFITHHEFSGKHYAARSKRGDDYTRITQPEYIW